MSKIHVTDSGLASGSPGLPEYKEVCDACGGEMPVKYEVRIPRPSDPTDMCCVMWVCKKCAGSNGGAKTAQEWDKWIETEGRAKGFIWLS